MATIDLDILRAVLVGYDHQRKTIEEKIAELKRQLGGRAPKASASQIEPPANASHYRQSPTSASQPHRKNDGLLSTQSRN